MGKAEGDLSQLDQGIITSTFCYRSIFDGTVTKSIVTEYSLTPNQPIDSLDCRLNPNS
jgi:hypothetical protein